MTDLSSWNTVEGTPLSSVTRCRRDSVKSISPFIARAVMDYSRLEPRGGINLKGANNTETWSSTPRNFAISSITSCSIKVESMSNTARRLYRLKILFSCKTSSTFHFLSKYHRLVCLLNSLSCSISGMDKEISITFGCSEESRQRWLVPHFFHGTSNSSIVWMNSNMAMSET